MTSCWEVVKIIKGVVNNQNIYKVKLRGILYLKKIISNEFKELWGGKPD